MRQGRPSRVVEEFLNGETLSALEVSEAFLEAVSRQSLDEATLDEHRGSPLPDGRRR
jgi:hypothetical protein